MNSDVKGKRFSRYYSAIHYLESLGNIGRDYRKANLKSHPHPEMYLERMQDFLDRIDNPEKSFKYIHITGTAGKGSVSTLVHANLVRAGKKAGLFTSPFTVSTIEKIQVGSKYIDPKVFADITEWLKPHIDDAMKLDRHGAPSYFELMLAIALLYFRREDCEYVVLEVGLGGRYDATNVIKKPLITAITNIGLDHTHILGPRRSDIARDKAGIIKRDSVFYTSEADPKIRRIFEDECHKVGSAYHALPVKGLSYRECNKKLAAAICMKLGVIAREEDLFSKINLSARFEIIERKPYVVIDGAHNPSKMESTIANLAALSGRKVHLVVAISADKDWKTMMKFISKEADVIHVTRFNVPGRQAVDPKLLYKEAKKHAKSRAKVRLFSDPVMAFSEARKFTRKNEVLLVTGSFYLAGDIRSLYCPEEKILRQRTSEI